MEQAKTYTKRENARRAGVATQEVSGELRKLNLQICGWCALRLEGDGSTGTRCRSCTRRRCGDHRQAEESSSPEG